MQSPFDNSFNWPTIETIKESQAKCKELLKDLVLQDGIYRREGKTWIPHSKSSPQLNLLVVTHCGNAGNCTTEAAYSILREKYR